MVGEIAVKIGTFAKQFGVSIDTVRYYIELGLIIPEKKGTQFQFDQTCCDDMAFIAELKQFRFTLQEIHEIVSFKRITNFTDDEDFAYYMNHLIEKKHKLLQQQNEISQSIRMIEQKIVTLRQKSSTSLATGVPLPFVPLFYCPACQMALRVKDAIIEEKYMMKGSLHCRCGYQARVDEGILIATQDDETPPYDSDIYDLETMQELTPQFISLIEKGSLTVYKQLMLEDLSNKVVVETNVDVYVFLPKYLASLQPNALYVFSGYSVQMMKKLKSRMERINPLANILYMVTGDLCFPLKAKSIDIVVDSFSFNDFSLLTNSFPMAQLNTYLKSDAKIFGCYLSYQYNAKSLKNIQALYPTSHHKTYFPEYLDENLPQYGFQVLNKEYIGCITSTGSFLDYHEDGEKIHLTAYTAGSNRSSLAAEA